MKQIQFVMEESELRIGTVTCEYCGETHALEEVDHNANGFWCEPCGSIGVEYFNYYDPNQRPSFLLFLERRAGTNDDVQLRNKVKFNKRLSPLRYPGGKSKVVYHLAAAMRPEQLDHLISPFAGGASVELALLQAGLVKHVTLNDLDFGIYALFTAIQQYPADLMRMIHTESTTHDAFFRSRELIVANYKDADILEAAWAALLVNRLAYSGIYKANPLGGRSGNLKQLLARFNPVDLCKRIEQIHAMSDRLTVTNDDATTCVEEQSGHTRSTLFIDPLYYEKGHQLYRHFFTEEQHQSLYWLLESLYEQLPSSDIIVTYDDHPFIRGLYERHAKPIELKRSFSA